MLTLTQTCTKCNYNLVMVVVKRCAVVGTGSSTMYALKKFCELMGVSTTTVSAIVQYIEQL